MPDDPDNAPADGLAVADLGRLGYADALAEQQRRHAAVVEARRRGARTGDLLLVEHDPVITVTRRPAAAGHVLLPEAALRARGVGLAETDRGGDVTYHGPGQLVAYPIVDLNRLGLRIGGYLRLLEEAVIAALAPFGVAGVRDPAATGVWVGRGGGAAKVCAIGVRVRRWVTLHGLAVNVDPDMDHFRLIVPCGLAGRPVTSLRRLLGDACPPMDAVKAALAGALAERLAARAAAADAARGDPAAQP